MYVPLFGAALGSRAFSLLLQLMCANICAPPVGAAWGAASGLGFPGFQTQGFGWSQGWGGEEGWEEGSKGSGAPRSLSLEREAKQCFRSDAQ